METIKLYVHYMNGLEHDAKLSRTNLRVKLPM